MTKVIAAVAIVVIGFYGLAGLWIFQNYRRNQRGAYPVSAAEVPDPVDEHFKTSPTEEDQLEAAFRPPAYIKEQSNG